MQRPKIEPLEKARWERIERGLRERLEQAPVSARQPNREERSWRPVAAFVLAGAAASLIGAIAWNELRAAPRVVGHSTTPSVTRVETRDAPSHVVVGESSLEVAAQTVARIEGNDDLGVNVSLDRGAIDCEVSPRHGRPPFVVHAGDVTVRVVGTHFHVDHDDVRTHVSVQHGAVEVESHGRTVLVAAGSSWPSAEHAENVQATRPEDLPRAPSDAPSAHVASSATSTTTPMPPPPPSSRERYDRAAALEGARPDEALAIYRELAAGTDSWAMNALYAEARLELERGDKENAKRRFVEYVRRYPTGPNANDARELAAKLQ